MTKKLLPTMIGAVLVGGMTAAQADVTVFGHLDVSVLNFDADAGLLDTAKMPGRGGEPVWVDSDSVLSFDADDTNLNCTTCSIGFKGSEDLGNGLSAIFKLDFQFDMMNRNSSGSITDRDQWLGLAGGFGSVKVGTISTSYKSHGAMIDPLYRTAVQGRDFGHQSFLHSNAGEEGEGRADNTVRWDSPNWNGLKVTAHYTLDSDEGSDCYNEGAPPAGDRECEDDDGYGIGAQYSNGGILVFADYITNDSSSDVVALTGNEFGDLSAWKVGGKYTMDNFGVYGQYEDVSNDFGSGLELDAQYWHLAGSYSMGNSMLYLGYGSMSSDDLLSGVLDPGFGTEIEQTAITLAGTHNLSKRTMLYAAYVMVEQDNDNFLNDPILQGEVDTGESVSDPELDVIAVGIKHKF